MAGTCLEGEIPTKGRGGKCKKWKRKNTKMLRIHVAHIYYSRILFNLGDTLIIPMKSGNARNVFIKF